MKITSKQSKEINVNYFQIANKYKKEGFLEQAITAYEKAIEQNPKFYWAYHNLGEALAQLDRWEEAATAYTRARELNPNSAWSHYNLAEILSKLGHLDEAIIAYHRAIDKNPNFYGFYNSLGKTFYELALQVNSDFFQSYPKLENEILPNQFNDEEFSRNNSQINSEDFIEQVYLTYLKRNSDPEGKNHYLQALSNGATREEVIAWFRQSSEFMLLLNLSTVLSCLEKVISAYRQSIYLNPNDSKSYDSLREALVHQGKVRSQQGQFKEAMESYEQAIAIRQHHFTKASYDLAEAHYEQGNLLRQEDKLDEAIESYHQAVALKPDWAEAHFNLGNILLKQEKIDEAVEKFNLAIAIDPKSVELHSRIAYFFLETGHLNQAITYCERAILINPNFAEMYLGVGTALLQQGKQDEGIKSFRQAIAIQPDWIHTYIAMGAQLFIGGNINAANQAWHEGIEVQKKLAQVDKIDELGIRLLDASWLLALGHIACLDIYLKIGLLGWRPQHKTMMLVTPYHKIPNQALLNYWKPYIEFISDPSQMPISNPSADYLTDFYWATTLPSGKTLMNSTQVAAVVYKQWEEENRPPLLNLSDSDAERGWDCLQKLGMPKNAWFVSLHVREPGFHKNWNKVHPATRDADINTYLLAVKSITARGGWVIRMGDPTMKPLPKMDKLIDYAYSEYKSDWMDIFLCASCKFLIGTSSGVSWIPPIFGVPCALTNWMPIGLPPSFPKNIFIPKLYFLESEKRYLTFWEIFSSPIIYSEFSKYYDSNGLIVVDNTEEEINDVVVEMLNYLEGKINDSPQDRQLQEQFHTLATTYGSYRGSPIGQSFLKKYAALFKKE